MVKIEGHLRLHNFDHLDKPPVRIDEVEGNVEIWAYFPEGGDVREIWAQIEAAIEEYRSRLFATSD